MEGEQLRGIVLHPLSARAGKTSFCHCCAKRYVVAGGTTKVLVRLTELSATFCEDCACALRFDVCTNKPSRGSVVPACAACVRKLEASTTPGRTNQTNGLGQALDLIKSSVESIKKAPLHAAVLKFSGSRSVPDAIYDASGKEGLAARIVSTIAMRFRDPAIADVLRAPPQQKSKYTVKKGARGLTSRDVRFASCPSWADRTTLSRVVGGEESLELLEVATMGTRERYRDAKVKSVGQIPVEQAGTLTDTRRAARLEATLAHASRKSTRETATRKADLFVQVLSKRRQERADFEEARSDAERERLAERRKKHELVSQGVTLAEQAGTDPRNGETAIENDRDRVRKSCKTARWRAQRRRAAQRDASETDHVTAAVDAEATRRARIAATKKRQRDDPGSCKTIYCTNEKCRIYDDRLPYGGNQVRVYCKRCGTRVTFE